MQDITQTIAEELSVRQAQVQAAVALMDEGATVPFISRYRKEATDGLDDTQLRRLEERLVYLRELQQRKQTVLKSIDEQGKLDKALEQAIMHADTKVALEDLYRPYMPKRRSKATLAREAGLAPFAEALLKDPSLDPRQIAQKYINPDKGIADADAALAGARSIVIELIAEHAGIVAELRDYGWQQGFLHAKVVKGKDNEGSKFADYFDYREAFKKIPSHRSLALFRGAKTGVLQIPLVFDDDEADIQNGEKVIAKHMGIAQMGRPADPWLWQTVQLAWRAKMRIYLETELKRVLREQAEAEAIKVFAHNLHDLLLSAPAGAQVTMGLDPGIRTGVKVAVVSETGKLLDTATIYPFEPKKQWQQSLDILTALVKKHGITLVAIGNGTASRETDKLAGELLQQLKSDNAKLVKVMVSEAGASVYSASAVAAKEFPGLDVSLRGAVSIARRLQDPLAELVKIEPKSIGVGQYQHDVNQNHLGKSLETVVEDCVNAVGVDVNTASPQLLKHVAGLNASIAENIVMYRDEHGRFPSRKKILEVPRLGPKAYEQAAGFLRIRDGNNPLDASAVHPEAYPVVERIMAQTGADITELIGNQDKLRMLNAGQFVDERFGEPTVRDIITELEKPGRDPRPTFQTATFKEDVHEVKDLQPGMSLQGMVSNVTKFGCFVDVGVHQDGLVHISELADEFVKDPRTIVKAGDVVQVKVLEVDANRKRISLTMRKNAGAKPGAHGPSQKSDNSAAKTKPKSSKSTNPKQRARKPETETAMAAAFANLRVVKKK